MLVKQKGLSIAVGTTLISFGFVCSAEAASFYSVTDLGSLIDSSFSFAQDINNSGQVIFNSGLGTDNGSPSRSFLYSNDRLTEINPLPGDTDLGVTSINSAGRIVGNSVKVNVSINNPFVYRNGKTKSLVGLNDANPYAINNKGEIVGGAQIIGPFLYRNRKIINFGTEGTVAYDINNRSQVVGVLNTMRARKAFLYENGKTTDLGTLPGDNSSSAEGINDRGQVVGYSSPRDIDDGRAFLYSKDTGLKSLGRLSPSDRFSTALDINNKGQVVGFSGINSDFFATNGGINAFIYKDGKLQDLNDLIDPNSDLTITQARAINNRGQIVGAGAIDGELHAVLLSG